MRLRNLAVIISLSAFALVAGCTTSSTSKSETTKTFKNAYVSVKDSGYTLPAIPINRVNSKYHRQIVTYRTSERAGTIIVDTPNRFLYYVLPGNKAVRYGIGVGKAGFAWQGEAYVAVQ